MRWFERRHEQLDGRHELEQLEHGRVIELEHGRHELEQLEHGRVIELEHGRVIELEHGRIIELDRGERWKLVECRDEQLGRCGLQFRLVPGASTSRLLETI